MAKVKIFGAPVCRVSFQLRDFLKRSSVDFDWVELKSDDEARQLPGITDLGDQRLPVREFDDGVRLYRPSVRDVAERLSFPAKPTLQEYDLSIYGAGPAGLSAAVYAASGGLKTILIERCAVGGQAGSSSRIENFLGILDGISRANSPADPQIGCEIFQLQEGVYAKFMDGKTKPKPSQVSDGREATLVIAGVPILVSCKRWCKVSDRWRLSWM